MNLKNRFKDSYLIGILTGLISLAVFYYLVSSVRALIINYYDDPYKLRPPFVQLVTMLINVILFRVIVINFEKEKTGKGILLVTVIATLAYFYIFYRIKR